MSEQRPQRQLSAILAADVAGYSRLIGSDEEGTFARLKELRRTIIDPQITEHRGRIVKTMGDGLLVQFASAVDAVRCAVELQRQMAEQNSEADEDRRIEFRIGINLGDVVIDGEDIHGDGVNIAARLEALAEPGGICASASVHDQVRDKLDIGFGDAGEQHLKNITRPVRVYRALLASPGPQAPALATKPSIAILPFVNMSGDPEQQYFSDGITEDIITELSRFRSLFVIARNSSFQYRAATDAKRIGRELGVQYLVEGSVRRSSSRLRITAQLIDAGTGNHLWAEHYDRDMQDVFAVQDEVAKAITTTIEGRMAASGAERSRRQPTSHLAAYDYFLQGREGIERRGDPEEASKLLRQAIALDANFALACAWLAQHQVFQFHRNLQQANLEEAITLAKKSVSLDDGDPWAHNALGYVYLFKHQYELAGLHFERAIALNPTDSRITSTRALWLAYVGRGEEAVRSLDIDLRRDPYPPAWYWNFRGVSLFQAQRYEEVVQAFQRLPRLYVWDCYYLAAIYAQFGAMEQARIYTEEILKERPNFHLNQVGLTEVFQKEADLNRLLDGLRKAGLPE